MSTNKSSWMSLTFEDTRRLLRSRICGNTDISIYGSASVIRSQFRPEEKLYCVKTGFDTAQYEREVNVIEQVAYSGQPALLFSYGAYVDINQKQPIILPPIVEELLGVSVLVAGYTAYFYWKEQDKDMRKLPFIRVRHVLMRPVPEAFTPVPMIESIYDYVRKTDWEPIERGERRRLVPDV